MARSAYRSGFSHRARSIIVPSECSLDQMSTFSLNELQSREISIHGVMRYSNTYPAAIALVSSGRFPIEQIITKRFSLDDVQAAFEAAAGRKDEVTKVLVEP